MLRYGDVKSIAVLLEIMVVRVLIVMVRFLQFVAGSLFLAVVFR